MSTGLPYRPPAGGWRSPLGIGGCFQQWRSGLAHTQVYQNLTRVPNWLCSDEGGGGVIPPYTRYDGAGSQYAGANPNCRTTLFTPEGEDERKIFPGDPNYCATVAHPNKPPCNAWTRAEFEASCASGETRIYDNCYAALAGASANLSACQSVGFRAATSRKVWHGSYAYNDPDRPKNWGICDTPSSPSDTKYLTHTFRIEVSFTHSQTNMEAEGKVLYEQVYTAKVNRTWTVNPLTGRLSVTCGEDEDLGTAVTTRGGEPWGGEFGSGLDHAFTTPDWFSAVQTLDLDCDDILSASIGWIPNPFPGGTASEIMAAIALLFPDVHTDVPGTKTDVEMTTNDVQTWGNGFSIEWDQTGSIVLDWDPIPPTPYRVRNDAVNHLSVLYEQSDPYTTSDVEDEGWDLLDLWNLADDSYNRWRTDRWTTVNPLLTYNEVPTPVGPPYNPEPCNYVDPYEDIYSGELLGQPFTAGHPEMRLSAEPYTETHNCSDSTPFAIELHAPPDDEIVTVTKYNAAGTVVYVGVAGVDYNVVQHAHGNWQVITTGVDHRHDDPENPTEATLNCTATNNDDYLVVTYTYTGITGGHFDWRHISPRFWYDVYSNPPVYRRDYTGRGAYSGGAFSVDPTDGPQPLNATQWTGGNGSSFESDGRFLPHGAFKIWGTGTQAGVLWMQKYAEIKLPWKSQDWGGPSEAMRDLREQGDCAWDEGTEPCVYTPGDLVWPDAWPIRADRAVTFEDPTGGEVKANVSPPVTYLRAGAVPDRVDFTNSFTTVAGEVLDQGPGDAGYEVTEVAADGSWFKFTASAKPTTAEPTLCRVKSHGAPRYWWFDTDGKGDFSAISHAITYRGETVETPTVVNDSLSFNRCYPAVMCWSPNYDGNDPNSTMDKFPHGKTYNFGSVVADGRFGSRWQGVFRQAMRDRTWVKIVGSAEVALFPPNETCDLNLAETGCAAGSWSEDPGSCAADTYEGSGVGTKYFAHRPMVEAREAMPEPWMAGDTAPTWYSDTTVYTAGGDVGPADVQDTWDTPNCAPVDFAPWGLWLDMQRCICEEGRFAEDYKLILGCWMCGEEP